MTGRPTPPPPLPEGLDPPLQFSWGLTSTVDVHSRNAYFPKNKSRVKKDVFLRPLTIQWRRVSFLRMINFLLFNWPTCLCYLKHLILSCCYGDCLLARTFPFVILWKPKHFNWLLYVPVCGLEMNWYFYLLPACYSCWKVHWFYRIYFCFNCTSTGVDYLYTFVKDPRWLEFILTIIEAFCNLET